MSVLLFQRTWRLCRYVAVRFYKTNCLTHASSLTYSSLLALIPFVTLMFSVLRRLSVFKNVLAKLQAFIFQNFVPETSRVVQGYVDKFMGQAEHLPLQSGLFLLVTALVLMLSMEMTLNSVWEIKFSRNYGGSLLAYWLIITLGPVFLAMSVLATSYLATLNFWPNWVPLASKGVIYFLPTLCEFLGYSILYWALPHCSVRLRHAMAGGLVATLLFEGGKKLFALYVMYFPTYQLIYGALAALPLFLLWLFCCWAIFLIGSLVVNGLRLGVAYPSTEET